MPLACQWKNTLHFHWHICFPEERWWFSCVLLWHITQRGSGNGVAASTQTSAWSWRLLVFNHALPARRACCGSPREHWRRGVSAALTDFQLPLDAALAALPVVRLGGVVFRHHLHEFARQRGVLEGNRQQAKRSVPTTNDCSANANHISAPYLRLAYPQVSWWSVLSLLLLDGILNT